MDGKGGIGGAATMNGKQITVKYIDLIKNGKVISYGSPQVVEQIGSVFRPGKSGTDGSNQIGIKYPEVVEFQPAHVINRFKYEAREYLANNQNSPSTQLAKFLIGLESNEAVNSLYDTLAFVDELQGLEIQYYRLKEKMPFRALFKSLLNRIAKYAKHSGETFEIRRVLRFVYTATLSKIIGIENYYEYDSIVNLLEYTNLIYKQIHKLRGAEKDVAITEYENKYKEPLNVHIELAKNVIKMFIIPGIEVLFSRADSRILRAMKQRYGLLSQSIRQMISLQPNGTLSDESNSFSNQNVFSHEHEIREFLTELQNPQTSSKILGYNFEMEMSNRNWSDRAEMFNSKDRNNKFHTIIVIMFRTIENIVNGIAHEISNAPQIVLNPNRWFVQLWLREMKVFFRGVATDIFAKDMIERSFENIDEAIDILMDTYGQIVSYSEKKSLATYLENIVSWNAIETENFQLNDAVHKLKKVIQKNLVLNHYDLLFNAFKQHHFPLAPNYISMFELPTTLEFADNNDLIQRITEKIDHLKDKIKFLDLSKYERGIHTDVEFGRISSHRASITPPFYVWKHLEITRDIRRLFQGEEIYLEADIHEALFENAVKFNEIGIQFKIDNKAKQQQLNLALENYSVIMKMSDYSYYRCDSRVYRIPNGKNIVIDYTFKRHPNGKPCMINKIYKKLSENDYFLSPYSKWAIQLKKVTWRSSPPRPPPPPPPTADPTADSTTDPTKGPTIPSPPPIFPTEETTLSWAHNLQRTLNRADFEELKPFLNDRIDIELVGRGQFLNDGNLTPIICNENLDRFYQLHSKPGI